MRVLVVGSGGREHALVWKVRQSPRVSAVFCAPGNAGIARMATCVPIAADDVTALRDWARENRIDLTIPGPEVSLVAGITDSFEAAGLKVWGPSQAAARLEGSKSFAKQFMRDHNIPTAAFQVFDDYDAACAYIRERNSPLVIKADGLAAGKGVYVCDNSQEALDALDAIMIKRIFGDAGRRVVIEERLSGPEVSVLAICDGKQALPLIPARDHKRLLAGDRGPNTGGMGVVAPVTAQVDYPAILETIIQPALDGMAQRGTPYTGVLYAGLMLTGQGPQVLEFNCRFGDPEAQAILPLLQSDLIDVIEASMSGDLLPQLLCWKDETSVCVMLAAAGYPDNPHKGDAIEGCTVEDEARYASEGVIIFHSGTALRDGQLVTAGGRVLGVTGLGKDFVGAREKAYKVGGQIDFAGKQFRHDIGKTVAEGGQA